MHRDGDASLPDTSSLQTVTFRFPAAPCDAAVPRRNIQAHTLTGSRHRQYPCTGTNTQSLSDDSYLLQLTGTIQSQYMTFSTRSAHFGHSDDLVHASRNQKIFSQSFATKELQIE